MAWGNSDADGLLRAIGDPLDTEDVQQAETMDLITAVNYALVHNRGLQQARLAVLNRETTLRSDQSEFRIRTTPDGTLSTGKDSSLGRYGLRFNRKLQWGTELSVRGGYEMIANDEEDDVDRATARVQINQPLFSNAGSLVTLDPVVSSELAVVSARRVYSATRADLVLDVVRAYEGVLRSSRQVKAERKGVERLQKLYRLTRAREAQGTGSKIDTLRVGVQLGDALARLAAAVERQGGDREALGDALGWHGEFDVALEPSPLLKLDLPGSEEAEQIARENRLDYAEVLQGFKDTMRKIKIAEKSLLPDMSVIGRYRRLDDTEQNERFEFGDEDWFIGLTFGSDLNRYRERATLQQRVLERTDARLRLEQFEYDLFRQVRQQGRAYRRALTTLQINARSTTLAKKRLDLAANLFEIGEGDNFTVTDAEDAYLSAQNSFFDSRAEASLAGYRLLRVLGTLVAYPEELKPNEIHEE